MGAVVRKGVGRRIDSWRSHDRAASVQDDSLGRFVGEHVAGVRLTGVVVAVLFMFFWPRLTVGIVLVTMIGLIVYLALVEVVRPHGPVGAFAADGEIDLNEAESDAPEKEHSATKRPG